MNLYYKRHGLKKQNKRTTTKASKNKNKSTTKQNKTKKIINNKTKTKNSSSISFFLKTELYTVKMMQTLSGYTTLLCLACPISSSSLSGTALRILSSRHFLSTICDVCHLLRSYSEMGSSTMCRHTTEEASSVYGWRKASGRFVSLWHASRVIR